jgi:hypothetical protein
MKELLAAMLWLALPAVAQNKQIPIGILYDGDDHAAITFAKQLELELLHNASDPKRNPYPYQELRFTNNPYGLQLHLQSKGTDNYCSSALSVVLTIDFKNKHSQLAGYSWYLSSCAIAGVGTDQYHDMSEAIELLMRIRSDIDQLGADQILNVLNEAQRDK